MSKIKIGTDSTADIPKPFCEELNISVLPLSILAGEKEYQDGVDITPSEFYRIIDESKELPVSSQVASVLYSELFEETWKAGYTDLIQVTLNSKGSGTYQAAVLSRDLFYEEHPEAKVVIQSLLPVSAKQEAKGSYVNNRRIAEFNTLLEDLAAEKDCPYLNVAEAVTGEDGCLRPELTTDGVHLNTRGCQAWLEYLKDHPLQGD